MRCFCGEKAIIKVNDQPLCKEHFIKYYLDTIRKTIEEYEMFNRNDRILLAVSGGKDSTALAYALYLLGYDFEGLYINLGIKGYSDKCEESVKKLFDLIDKKLNIIRIEDLGLKVTKVGKRPICSVCGIIKRYLMNKFAYENGFNVLVTAHNLSDEMAFHLINIKGNQLKYFLKLGPVLPEGPRLVKKVKPLYFLTEKENLVFCLINNLPFCHAECPYSKGNTQIKVKQEVYKFGDRFMREFVRITLEFKKYLEKIIKEEKRYWFCKICGYPTEARDSICAFCKIAGLLRNK